MAVDPIVATNATGWNELLNGSPISAAWAMYTASTFGWAAAILFFAFELVCFIKTRNVAVCVTNGIIFLSLFGTGALIPSVSMPAMIVLTVLELAGVLYFLIV